VVVAVTVGAAAALVAACTFSGMGDYTICSFPSLTTVPGTGSVASVTDLAMMSGTGAAPVAAYIPGQAGCMEAVDALAGPITSTNSLCSLLATSTGLVPHQPFVVNVSSGEAVFITDATASGTCSSGAMAYTNQALSGAVVAGSCDDAAEATLPSYATLSGGGNGVAAWYRAPYLSFEDPLSACPTAAAAPLVYSVVSYAATTNASLSSATVLATQGGVSVRPPALIPLSSTGGAALAAPTGSGVGVWTFDSTGNASSTPTVTISGMSGAKAVAMATDGAQRLAVVAEIGCAPQSIAFAVGSDSGGFSTVVQVVPAGASASDKAFQPTVAWVTGRGDWLVTWISLSGGAHVLARRFSAAGVAEDAVFDPSISAVAAAAGPDGKVFAYDATTGVFATADLKCVP